MSMRYIKSRQTPTYRRNSWTRKLYLFFCLCDDLLKALHHVEDPQCQMKDVETTGSLIERLLPKSIHAVTARGFELKVALFVLACSINFLW